ncbi:MAG: response regulator [Candidatus Zixiibacteriota bacterium]
MNIPKEIGIPFGDSSQKTVDALNTLLKQVAISYESDYVTICSVERLGVSCSDRSVDFLVAGVDVDHYAIAEVIHRAYRRNEKRSIQYIADIEDSNLSDIDAVQTSGVKSAVVMPLRLASVRDASLVLLWFRASKDIDPQELENIIFYGRLVEILCDNSVVVKTSEEQANRLSALVELSTTIYSSLNYQVVLDKVIDLATSLVSASYATIYLIDRSANDLEPLLTNAEQKHDSIMAKHLPLGKGAPGQAAVLSEGVIVNGLTSDHPESEARENGSEIAVPLIHSGKTIGVLSIRRESGVLFTLEDLQFLSIFARQSADVIENARMFRDLQVAYNKLSLTQDQMVETEKLRVLGEMACGVAHDFNNSLGAILGRAELLQRKIFDPEIIKGLKEIEKLALQGAETVRRTQEFARVRSKAVKKRVMINEVIEDAVETTKPLWKEQAQLNLVEIEVTTDLRAKNPVAGSRGDLVDTIANMIQNSVEALPNGGRISIKTYDRNDEVVVEIVDDGVGMAPAVRDRVFYPFFTSKGRGKTGLGMSVAYGVLTRHQAAVEIESEEGAGTRIEIIFPARPELAESITKKVRIGIVKDLNILLVDDDEDLLSVVSELISALGHTVVTAPEGIEALARFDEKAFDMVITDLGLPGMSGWDIANAVRLRKPETPVILISGWGAQIAEADIAKYQVDLVLSKPFSLRQLEESIWTVLSAKTTDAQLR